MQCQKLKKKAIYRFVVQVAFELYHYFAGLSFQVKLHLPSIVLLNGFQSSLGAFKSTE